MQVHHYREEDPRQDQHVDYEQRGTEHNHDPALDAAAALGQRCDRIDQAEQRAGDAEQQCGEDQADDRADGERALGGRRCGRGNWAAGRAGRRGLSPRE